MEIKCPDCDQYYDVEKINCPFCEKKKIPLTEPNIEKPQVNITTTKCKYCSMTIPKDAKICPHCQKRLKTSTFVWILTIFFIIVGISTCRELISTTQSTLKNKSIAITEQEMDVLYKNPPDAKQFKFGYVLHKPSIKKINDQLYQYTLIQVSSAGTIKWDMKTDCENEKIAFGCGYMQTDDFNKIIPFTKSCGSGIFEPFITPKTEDWEKVVKVFCQRYNN